MEPNQSRDGESVAGAGPAADSFGSTPWSVALRARDKSSPEARSALEVLCRSYWYPIYAFIRRRGASADDAEDSTQAFFTRFVEKGFANDVEPAHGKFRSYLLACCRHFLANERRHALTEKCGGGQMILSLDGAKANQRYLYEPADTHDAEKLYDRRWALTLLEESLDRLAQEYEQEDKKPLFEELKKHLVGDDRSCSYADVAGRLGMTEAAVKKAAQRLRNRYAAIVRSYIRATVNSPNQVEDEIRDLIAVISES
jgi:RNA polymerase sigma-70 factor (ECF subfamily)